mgnify:CR=1 FL=1
MLKRTPVFYAVCWLLLYVLYISCIDKKNENKSVAVEDFLPAAVAVEAIKYSMYVVRKRGTITKRNREERAISSLSPPPLK